jgi:hypothetical protein
MEKGADTNFLGFHCQVAQSSQLASILSTSCFFVERSSPAGGAWECLPPPVVGLTMPIGREKVATVVLTLDIILISVMRGNWSSTRIREVFLKRLGR